MRVGRAAAATALVGLVGLSAAARFLAARPVSTPWIVPDETLYALLGRGLYGHGRLDVLGHDVGFYSAVYPALAGLPLELHDLAAGYTLLKLVQALVMSLTAVPVFLWSRRLAGPRWALLAAALTVAIPGLAYSGLVLTETAFYPAVVLAAWATAAALERPALARQALVVAAVALAAGVRLQALVLVPAVLTAVLVHGLLLRDRRAAVAAWPLAAGAAVLAVAGLAAGSTALGGYAPVAHGGYAPGRAAEYVLYHAGALLLLCGVAPACAVALLLVDAVRGRACEPALGAYLAVGASFSAWIVVEVGVFASRFVGGIAERNLLPLAPLLFVGFAAWLARGAPRTYVAAAVVAFAAAALVVAIPYGRFVAAADVHDSMTFAAALAAPDPLLALAVPAVAVAAAVALLPRRLLPALALLLVAALVAASVFAAREVRRETADRQAKLLGPHRRWIDAAADGPVAYVFGGGAFFTAVWENAFWNRRIAAVYDTPGARVDGPLPQVELTLRGDGVLRAGGRPIPERWVVLPSTLTAAGTPVATARLVGADELGRTLWRLDGVPRVLEQRLGFVPNGDIPYRAVVREYACDRGGTFLVTLLGKAAQTVDFALDGRHVQTVSVGVDEAPTVVVHAPPRPGACTLALRPSTLVGTTQVTFARG